MLTRAQSKQSKNQELDVTIDFDEASKAWLANKVRVGPGCYRYLCTHVSTDGKPCRRIANSCSGGCPRHTPPPTK
jgi:hypothetical protein